MADPAELPREAQIRLAAQLIAGRLSRGQRSCIAGLDTEPCRLGCGEPWAMRMSRAKGRRPALTRMTFDPAGGKLFALTPIGLAVKAALAPGGAALHRAR